jgi:hypothetical protein
MSIIPVSPVAALFAPSILVLKMLPASDTKLSAEADTQATGRNPVTKLKLVNT